MQFTFTIDSIKQTCKQVWEVGKTHKVWAFYGEMGAGKTTFIHNLCEYLDVTSAISSPTYAIINEYESSKAGVIYHMDWYRLKDEEEALQAGVEDCLLSGHFCLIEWPERAADLLPDDCWRLWITLENEQTRRISSL